MKMKFSVFALLFTLIVILTVTARGEPLDDARKLLADKEYSEVDKVLERELADSKPRPEVLKVSYAAAMAAGQFVTAERRVSALLKLTQNNDPDLLYHAAVTSDRIGDQQAATARYSMYAQKCSEKSDKLERALSYMLAHGAFPEEYKKYVKLFGATEKAWSFGAALLDRLCATPDPENTLKIASFMQQQYPDAKYVNYLHSRLRAASDNFELGRDPGDRFMKPMMVMAEAAPSDYAHINGIFQQAYASMTPQDRFNVAAKIQTAAKKPLSSLNSWMAEQLFSMRDIKYEEVRLAAGRSFLALEPMFRDSPDRGDYLFFMRMFAECPAVFAPVKDKAGSGLVSPAEALKKFDTLSQKYADSPLVLSNILQYIQNSYMSNDKNALVGFLKKNIAVLNPAQINDYMSLSGETNACAVLAECAKGRNFKDTLDARVGMMPWMNKSKEPEAAQQLLSAAKDYMAAYAGSFNWKHIRTSFINSPLLTFDQKIALLKEQVAQAGYSQLRSDLLKDMANDKENWASKPAFVELINAHNAKAPGTDVVMRNHIAMFKAANAKEAHEAAKKFLEEYKGQVPGGWEKAASVEGLGAVSIFDKERELSWNNAGDISALAELWVPRLGLGSSWEGLSRRLTELGKQNILTKIAPSYVALTKDDPGSPAVWNMLTQGVAAKGDFTNPLEQSYAKMGPDCAAQHIQRNWDSWQGKPQYFIEQAEKAVLGNAGKFSGNYYRITETLMNISSAQNKVPPALSEALLNSIIAEGKKNNSYDTYRESLCILQQARSGNDTGPMLAKYLPEIQKRTPPQQVEAIYSLIRNNLLPEEAVNTELKPGMRYHSILKLLKPAMEKTSPSSLARMSVPQNLSIGVDNLCRNWTNASIEAEAESLAAQIAIALGDGALTEGDPANMHGLLNYLCIKSIGAEKWDTASEMLTTYAILLGRCGNWDDNLNRIKPVLKLLDLKGAREMAYLFISTIERRANPPDKYKNQLAVIKAKAGSEIKGMIPVDKADPMYNLYLASQSLGAGGEERAWELTSQKLPLLKKEWAQLDPSYVAWVVEQMRKQKMYGPALEFAMTILLREKELDPEIAARISIAKGDTYRDMNNFQAARIEYDGLRNNPAYNRTVTGSKGVWRFIDLLIMTKDYTTATSLLERLVDSDKIETQAEAYYYLAKMAYQEQQYKESKDFIRKVKDRVLNHVEAAFLEGELNLVLPGGLQNQEVMVGNPRLALTVIPGSVLTLKLQDQNLSVARGGTAIPVVITTSAGKDEEHIKLLPSSTSKNLFVGQIGTALGNVQKNDMLLQLRGNDVVSYEIEKEFQKANDLTYPVKMLEVRYDARLIASSGEILTEEEEGKRNMEKQIRLIQQGEDNTLSYEARRDNRTIRPGSPVFVQVTDFTRDISDAADGIVVDLRTGSGDVLEGFKLIETGPHTGIFRGAAPTGIPLPRVTTSDGTEGKNPSSLINVSLTDKWTSLGDGKKPKWIEVDTMTSHLVKTCSIEVPDPAALKQMKFMGMLAENFEELAAFPPKDSTSIRGGLIADFAPDQKGETPELVRRHINLAGGLPQYYEKVSLTRDDSPMKGKDAWQTSRLRGTFWLPEKRAMELKFLQEPCPNDAWQHSYIFIDGQQVLGGKINASTVEAIRRIDLSKGAHRLEILDRCHWSKGKVSVGYRKDDGTFEPLPASWFSTKDNPQLAEYLKPKGTIRINDKTVTATLSEPVRLRKLQWIFDEFTGNGIAVNKVTLVNAEGLIILPTKDDFSSGLSNSTLEIAPGDQVTVSYRNDKRLREDTPVLESMLNSSFYNGNVIIANENISTKPGANERVYDYSPAKRCRSGDQLMIIVTDYDCDISNERDTVTAKITTSSGENLELKALESGPTNPSDPKSNHSGVFMAVLKIGDATLKNQIKINPGDILTVTYLDAENTNPGVPIERTYNVNEAGTGKPEFAIYKTTPMQVPDTSEEAKAKLRRMRTKDAEKTVMYKNITLAVHPEYENKDKNTKADAAKPVKAETSVAVNAPLLFEVNFPKMALNADSILKVEAVSDTEAKAAKAENRKPVGLTVPMQIKDIQSLSNAKGYPIQLHSHVNRTSQEMLRDGTFAGVIRLQIGSPGDPINDLVLQGERAFVSQEKLQKDKDGFTGRVPTLLVSGSDTVTLQVKDGAEQVLSDIRVRMLSDGRLEILDPSFQFQKSAIHLGEKFFVMVTDPDHDISNEQDKISVDVSASSGDTVKMELVETLAHSGVFTGSIKPEFAGEKVNGKAPVLNKADEILSVDFGDELTFTYNDSMTLSGQPAKVAVKGSVYPGSDAEMANFSKLFKDPEMAVKTNFLMAEALFEMGKEHRKLKQLDISKNEIDRGKRILEEAMRDYPNTTLVAQGEFLLANLAQELESYQEAIGRYAHVINTWPESEYAARSQFKKAICLEKMEQYEQACEEYVKLTYVYPDNILVADATVRMGNYYYKKEAYKVSGQIFQKFQQRNPTHQLAPKALFLAAQSYYKMKDYREAIKLFSTIVSDYTEQKDVREEAMYWLGDSHFNNKDMAKAYQTFKKLTWDYPEGRWAKIARGRLTEEAFSRIEEEK